MHSVGSSQKSQSEETYSEKRKHTAQKCITNKSIKERKNARIDDKVPPRDLNRNCKYELKRHYFEIQQLVILTPPKFPNF